MTLLAEIGSWISENEALLSGVAAMIVVGGVFLSAIGVGYRRLRLDRRHGDSDADGAPASVGGASGFERDSGEPAIESRPVPLTFKRLTAPSSHETRFANSGGVRIAYNERGSGPLDIICAPGIISHLNVTDNLPSTRGTYDCLEEFAHVVVFDKRGQGLSDPSVATPDLEQRTADIAAVMDAAGVERGILLGFSEGGPMCLHFTATHPDRVQGLVLVGTTARWVQTEEFPIGIRRSTIERLPSAWGEGVLRDIFFPSITREQMDDATYRALENLIGTRSGIRQVVQMMVETDVRPLLPTIRVPTLVLHFTGDLAVPIRLGRALAEGLPNAEFVEVHAVDHADLSQSAEAVARVRAFCERCAAEDVGATP
jgi:pimeloyl-ACP methyl ester carboxylesterase